MTAPASAAMVDCILDTMARMLEAGCPLFLTMLTLCLVKPRPCLPQVTANLLSILIPVTVL